MTSTSHLSSSMPINKEQKVKASKRYEKIGYIGEGQFALVYSAKDTITNKVVAIKKIKRGDIAEARDGVNRSALREIKLLQELQHENVIALLDVYGKDSGISLVFEMMATDLEKILYESNTILTPDHIKSYTLMTLKGLEYLHLNWILHRDLKPNNLLLDANNVLKIADFGLGRSYGSPTRLLSHQVVTRWYRAPELIFGAKMYATGIDIWAVGCILGELYLRNPLFPGDTDLETLGNIVKVLGTPSEKNWPLMTSLSDFIQFNEAPSSGIPLTEIFTAVSSDGIQMLESMLKLNPLERCDCTQALEMPFFRNPPYPTLPEYLPKFVKKKSKLDMELDNAEPVDCGGGGAGLDFGNDDSDADDNDDGVDSKSKAVRIKREPIEYEPIAQQQQPNEPDAKPSNAKRLKFET